MSTVFTNDTYCGKSIWFKKNPSRPTSDVVSTKYIIKRKIICKIYLASKIACTWWTVGGLWKPRDIKQIFYNEYYMKYTRKNSVDMKYTVIKYANFTIVTNEKYNILYTLS